MRQSPAHDPRWRADPAAELVWQRWEEAYFAFDIRSGQTHFLNQAAVSVLAALAAGPQSLAAIEDALLRAHGAEPDSATREAIADTLRVMSSLGLVEPMPPR